jgi:hypothetical protein
MNELSAERDKAFADAVEKTKTILTVQQQVKYEEFLKRREPGGSGRDRGPRGRRPETKPG